MKRIAADVWIPVGWTKADQKVKAHADTIGMAVYDALAALSAETKAWSERVRHETGGR